MSINGVGSGPCLITRMQPIGDLQNAWTMFDHVNHITSWVTMACHVYNLAYYKMMTIVIYNMQFKDIKVQQIMWKKLNEMMWKNRFPKPKFKGSMVDNAQANWKLSKLFMVMGTLLSRWLIKNAHVYSIGFSCLIDTPNSRSNLSCKITTKVFATNTRM